MDIKVNPIVVQNLYEMRSYTDQQAGTIFRQIPILEDGSRDPMRMESFGASTVMFINGQSLPITFQIEGATSLSEAIEKFPEAVKATVQKMHDEALRSQLQKPFSGGRIDLSKVKN